MELPQGLITQPRKKGRPKFIVRGVRDTDLIKSTPRGSVGGDNAANDSAIHEGEVLSLLKPRARPAQHYRPTKSV